MCGGSFIKLIKTIKVLMIHSFYIMYSVIVIQISKTACPFDQTQRNTLFSVNDRVGPGSMHVKIYFALLIRSGIFFFVENTHFVWSSNVEYLGMLREKSLRMRTSFNYCFHPVNFLHSHQFNIHIERTS